VVAGAGAAQRLMELLAMALRFFSVVVIWL
jgi:hypothetical protein